MKYIFFSLLCFFTDKTVFAKNVEGYVVLPNNDTLHVQVKIGSGFFFGIGANNVYKKVETSDSSGHSILYTPADIKGYGYKDKKGLHHYRVKPIQDSGMAFLEVIIDGPRSGLYDYTRQISGGYNSTFTEIFYTFEKKDGTVLFLKNVDKLETLQNKLKAFYGDNAVMQELIGNKFGGRKDIENDIEDIVRAYNKQ